MVSGTDGGRRKWQHKRDLNGDNWSVTFAPLELEAKRHTGIGNFK